ncbi:UNVERIFIED_CONTAM: Retrovirus-related Pol polyprotein from transposon gypsy [Sesamum radiatum]|uniref:Retrovirus-related Pol polyprotein from transposon gypsy n=1 Tax=Sesamum radiatum TaxID=300843 RepID=A0AAW2V214_SESRA
MLQAGYIRPVQYPEWLANVVVPKPNGKWRLCIDFTDLNKACPKDPFPLPRIDILVDSTSGCEMLSFLDAYQGYNQIPLAPEDQEKASFVTDQGVFCYNVMPFGLKNAGATYQRLVNHMFQNQIGRNMEVYIDDMLVKSEKEQDHIKDLEECFQILTTFGMKLNPAKCTFGRNPYISENAVSSVLVRQENREHLPVYYVSKVLQGAEPRYSQIEKLALSLVIAARKLRPYFQSPTIKAQVLADFVVELAYDEASISTPTWSLSTSTGSGAGVALESPQGDKFEYAIKHRMRLSTKHFLAGCELALAAGAKRIVIYSDSQLVVNQVQGSYEADEKMAKYFSKAKSMLGKFEEASVAQVSRANNATADQLAKLASSMAAIRSRKIIFISSERAAIEEPEEVICIDPTL